MCSHSETTKWSPLAHSNWVSYEEAPHNLSPQLRPLQTHLPLYQSNNLYDFNLGIKSKYNISTHIMEITKNCNPEFGWVITTSLQSTPNENSI